MRTKGVVTVIAVSVLLSAIPIHGWSPDHLYKQHLSLHFSPPVIAQEEDTVLVTVAEATDGVSQGQYLLPTAVHTLTFPLGTEIVSVSCRPRMLTSIRLPAPLAAAPGAGVRTSCLPQPEPAAGYPSPGTWCAHRTGAGMVDRERCTLLKIQVFPVQYHSADRSITWSSQMDITVIYRPSVATSSGFPYDFLVLAPSIYAHALQPLVDHKNQRDIATVLVTLEDVMNGTHFPVQGADQAEHIKYFIKNAVESWGITYVLAVGGSQIFPVRYAHPLGSRLISDLYYADLYHADGSFCTWNSDRDPLFGEDEDGVDLFPDVYFGRLACRTEEEVTVMVDKIMDYETAERYTQEWFRNLVVMAGDCFPDHPVLVEGEAAVLAAMDIMHDFQSVPLLASNGRLSGTSPTGVENILEAVNQGCGFFYYSGHGMQSKWFTYAVNDSSIVLPTPAPGGLLQTDVEHLDNGERLPVVVADCCVPCRFDDDRDCMGWSWMVHPTGGSVALFGGTTLTPISFGDQFTQTLIIKLALNMFRAFQQGAQNPGQMWCQAISDYVFPALTGRDYYALEQWQPFADPTLALAAPSSAPYQPVPPSGPAQGRRGQPYSYTASTQDPEGDSLYYRFDWGDGAVGRWLGPYASGETCTAVHTWNATGSYSLRVQARDSYGVRSQWSDPLPVSMPYTHRSLWSLVYDWVMLWLTQVR
ncbi:MAG: C25 family cysteine peptidase [Candidatus Thermoplasmatota archaeon]|nr:C25 family cysteine peptidase [Candidatus Thermoplasmatota archaeon]